MGWLTDFLNARIIEIYLVYGLGFFVMGMAVALETWHASAATLARATPWLAGFGILHGLTEWGDMFVKIYGHQLQEAPPLEAEALVVGLLSISFMWLLKFGCVLMTLRRPVQRCDRPVIPAVLGVYFAGMIVIWFSVPPSSPLWLKTVEAWTSYAVGLPAFAITIWGLVAHSRLFLAAGNSAVSRALGGAAVAFGWYAVLDVVFVSPLPYFPASVFNSDLFVRLFGAPVQLARAANAVAIAYFFINALRLFAIEDRRQLEESLRSQRELQQASEKLNNELRAAAREMSGLYEQLRQRDEVHSHLLQRVVRAQEEERKRVARDLHDGVGQTISGLVAGLGALEKRMADQDPSIQRQVATLSKYSVQALDELHRVMTDLRPSLLDELGLVAALRWYARHYTDTLPIAVNVDVHVDGPAQRLPQDVEIVLFRIAQEALTNVVRHARANSASIRLDIRQDRATLVVEDDGIGFDPAKAFATSGEDRPWGLLGMQERAALVGGTVDIESRPWQGTRVTAHIPLTGMNQGANT